jgi:molecular chaperone HscB
MFSDARCRACGAGLDPSGASLLCPSCGVVVEPHPQATPFGRLGLRTPCFGVDERTLERAWLDRSRQVHPDRHARRSDGERRAAAQQTAALNDAWRVLRAPFDRAVWLVQSVGVEEPRLSPRTLVEFMEFREEAAIDDAARRAVVERCAARFEDAMTRARAALVAVDAVGGWTTPTATALADVRRAAALLAEARTLARLVADLGGPRLVPSQLDR